jgi:hypothetical protein
MADLSFNKEAIAEIKKTYKSLKMLTEQKKSISEDIREEKLECSKKTGMAVKDINNIMKVLHARESGDYSEDYVKIAKAVEGIIDAE